MPATKPLVSVVVPVYNAEPYLAEAIESVLAQTHPPSEVILIDDGSTDGSAEIAKGFGDSLHYFYQKNQGVGAALTAGFTRARGEYICAIGSDDLWTKDKLALQLAEFAADSDLDMVFGQVKQFISPELDEASRQNIYCPPEPMPGYSAGPMLIKREAFLRVGNFDNRWEVGEFIDWYLRATDAGLNSKMLPQVVYRRRLHTSNLTIRKRDSYSDYTRIIKASLDRRRKGTG